MISSTLGAPLGGTTRGGHQGVESVALGLMTPPNLSGAAGICFPSIVVVALGDPSCPVTCWAEDLAMNSVAVNRNTARKLEMSRVISAGFRRPAAGLRGS